MQGLARGAGDVHATMWTFGCEVKYILKLYQNSISTAYFDVQLLNPPPTR